MNENMLFIMILIPALVGAATFALPKKAHGPALVLGAFINLVLNIATYGKALELTWPFGGWGIDFALKLYPFSAFILLCAAILTFLVAVYTAVFSKGKGYTRLLYGGMLLTLALVNGAVLANNLVVMLFFWEGILGTMFIMIMGGREKAYKTSFKAVIIAGVTDLMMMLGIGIASHLAGTLQMDKIRLPLEGWGLVAFILLVIGAISKAGAMPFHTWIPDAADDAPTPFLPFLPGTLEKLLGIYLLSRLTMDLFEFDHGSPMSYVLMTLGVMTIILAVMMALIQRDFKRLLSYHAISQVGYMMLGIGTALPVGIIGGIFHMLNHAVYKCCLFLTAGAVEKQTGTTDLNKLSGLRKKMPVTTVCFVIAALSIAGFPMTNGFFSKELIFDGAIESGMIFYIIAALGAFFTPISFLKLGHAVFFGPERKEYKNVKEAPAGMLAPMLVLAAACLGLGFFSTPMIQHVLTPFLGDMAHEAGHIGGHTNWLLVGISAALLICAALDHYRGFKKTGKGVESADHFHHAPVLKDVYDLAEKKVFDPYEMSRGWMRFYAVNSLRVNDAISRFYDKAVPSAIGFLTGLVKAAHNGRPSRYVWWVLSGLALTAVIFLAS